MGTDGSYATGDAAEPEGSAGGLGILGDHVFLGEVGGENGGRLEEPGIRALRRAFEP